MWVSTFVWRPRCGSLLLIGDLGVGPYFCLETQVWVHNSWMVAIARSLLTIIESLEYSDLVKQIFYHSRGSHNLDRPLIDLVAEYHFSNPDQLTTF